MKKILIFAMIIIVILTFTIATNADQYGATTYQFSSSEIESEFSEEVENNENKYTLMIDLESLWENNEFENGITYSFWQKLSNGTTQRPVITFKNRSIEIYYSANNTEELTTINYPNGYLYIPFLKATAQIDNNSTENPSALEDYTFFTVLNNQQYTGAKNMVLNAGGYNYQIGYAQGQNDAINATQAGQQLISTVVSTPINTFMSILNFEILGINVAGLIIGLLSLGLVVVIVKKVIL